MAQKQLSYDYQNLIRDLSNEFQQIQVQYPSIISLIPVSGNRVKSTKHEWLEDVVSEKTWTVDGAYTALGGTVTLDSTAGLIAGDIIMYEATNGASINTTHKVVTVASGTQITIAPYGTGVVDVNIADNAIVKLVSRPTAESSTAIFGDGQEPTVEYNYTEIIRDGAKVSRTTLQTMAYGINPQATGEVLNYQVKIAMDRMLRRMNRSILFGKRVARGAGESGTMGGILEFVGKSTSGNVIDASAGALTYDMLNSALKTGVSLGATGLNTIVVHPDQMTKISKFNSTIVQTDRKDSETGSFITRVLDGLGGVSNVVYDWTFPKDQLMIVDTSKLAIAYMEPLSDKDARQSDADDFVARSLLAEYTLQVKNASTSHVLIKNLAL